MGRGVRQVSQVGDVSNEAKQGARRLVNLKTRLTVHFLSRVLILFGIVCALGIAFIAYMTQVNVIGASGTNPVLVLKSMPAETSVSDDGVSLSPGILENVKDVKGWVQIFNGTGDEVFQYRLPSRVPTKYAPGLLLEYRAYPARFGYQVYSWYDKVHGQDLTWLLGVPYHQTTLLQKITPYLLMILVFVITVTITLFTALSFGRRLGMPLLYMLDWLQGLAKGNYDAPRRRRMSEDTIKVGAGENSFARAAVDASADIRLPSGELKRPFRLYEEVISALGQLSFALKHAQSERQELETTREEWITGVSHDLKTPLSSVKGYGNLLATTQYEWSQEEIRNFGHVITEKATHMETLIEDLGLTFRLRNEALPLQRDPKDIVEVVRRATIDIINSPDVSAENVTFECDDDEEILYPIDAKWFTRALDNLLSNAILHNPENTPILVRVERAAANTRYPGVHITISDRGNGMDENTVAHLFERYYRGTNTSARHAQGSGLGCAIAKQLIESHGGTIEVRSKIGAGTTFTITLPARN